MDINQSTENTNTEAIDPAVIRKSTQKSMLKGLGNVLGTEFQSVEELYAFAATLKNQSQPAPAQSQVKEEPESRGRTTTNELAEQIRAMQEAMAKKDQQLAQERMDNQLTRALGDKFDPDLQDAALHKIQNQIKLVDGIPTVVTSSGTQRYNDNGQPMTIDEVVNEVARANPKLLKQRPGSQTTGSGIRGVDSFGSEYSNGDVPDYSVDPAAFKKWAQGQGLYGEKTNSALAGMKLKITNLTPRQ
jgi:hypothetical protein